MPAGFDMCVKKGGRVRTKDLGKGKYMHICFLGGKSYPGYVKTKSENKEAMMSKSKYSMGLMNGK